MKPYRLQIRDAIRIKSAELWLRLGERKQALFELRALPPAAWDHPATRELISFISRQTRDFDNFDEDETVLSQ